MNEQTKDPYQVVSTCQASIKLLKSLSKDQTDDIATIISRMYVGIKAQHKHGMEHCKTAFPMLDKFYEIDAHVPSDMIGDVDVFVIEDFSEVPADYYLDAMNEHENN